MKKTMYASFVDRDQAMSAAGALMDHGVEEQDLSIIVQGTQTDYDQYQERDMRSAAAEDVKLEKPGISVTTPADAASGAAKGAGIGLGAGVVAGLAALFVPGFGLVLGGGALATALAGAGLSAGAGAIAGGATGYLKDQGVPETEAVVYNDVVTKGGALLAFSWTEEDLEEQEVMEVLSKYGAENVQAYGVV